MSQSTTIGFIGLGLLGSAMARRLKRSGFNVHGHDLDPAKTGALAEDGIKPASSITELAQRCDWLMSCVTATPSIEALADEVRVAVAAGQRCQVRGWIDFSTTDLARTRELAADLPVSTGITFIDAPVSGGPGAADQGELAIMVGCEATRFDADIAPLLASLGRVTRMGDAGAGQATKLVNQALVLSNYCVIAEAVRLGQKLGIEVERIPAALATGHAGSNLLPVLVERMAADDFEPRGYARQVLKDLEMLNKEAANLHLPMPMAGQALNLFRMLVANGDSERDGAAVITLLSR